MSLNYTYKIENVRPYAGAPLNVQLAAGSLNGSQIGFTYAYNDLDDIRKPTTGSTFAFSQQFSGFGGNMK